MELPDLESAFRDMLERIAEKGGSSVELVLNGPQQSLQISRANGSGEPVEKFLLWYHPSFGGEYIVAYQLFDWSLLRFKLSGVPEILNGIPITKKDYTAFESFVELVKVEARKSHGSVINCQESYPLARVPYLVARFYERMIVKP